jgi:hypothetical protein
MRVLRVLVVLAFLPGCAMDDPFLWDSYEQEYYVPAETGCQNYAPMPQPAATPAYSPSSPVQPAGYQTREPPTM